MIAYIKFEKFFDNTKKEPSEAGTSDGWTLELYHLERRWQKMQKVQIVPNNRGGFSIKIDCQEIGNYATFADALRIVKLNGFQLEA